MTRISQLQIEEILEEVSEIRIRKHRTDDLLVVETYRSLGADGFERADREVGADVGGLLDELHSRL